MVGYKGFCWNTSYEFVLWARHSFLEILNEKMIKLVSLLALFRQKTLPSGVTVCKT